jgi:hypothetical protein
MKTVNKKSPLQVFAAVLFAVGAVFAAPTHAALVQLCGQTVCYEYEDNPALNDGLQLFGAPRLLGNSDVLSFTPSVFNAMSYGPGGLDERTASFHFSRIWSPVGLEIGAISISDSGDYQIYNGGSVAASLVLHSNDLLDDGQGPGYLESVIAEGSIGSSVPTGLPFQNWSQVSSINPAATFADLATSVDLSIVSTLRAVTDAPGHAAFVARKLSLTAATTAAVPAPAAFWLLATGGVLLASRSRRRSLRLS